jgi:CYTH domain-containing protein
LSEQRVPPVEIERKYLLAALPEAVRGAESVEIDQGWLPGERLQERLRRASNGAEDRFYRTVKLGRGITRTEIEEEAPRQLFEQLWPLTDGRRLRKRRYYVPEGALTWEIDEFLDRELVLAEVELPAPETQVSLPGWLAPLVEREVTGEAAYLNVNLAQ